MLFSAIHRKDSNMTSSGMQRLITEQAAEQTTTGLDDLAVDRRALDALLARGLISTAARDHALGLIEPPRDWGLWAGRLIAVVGAALVLAGIVYFFAFNWAAIPPLAKLGGIALGIAAAIATAAVLGLDHAAAGYATSAATVTATFVSPTAGAGGGSPRAGR